MPAKNKSKIKQPQKEKSKQKKGKGLQVKLKLSLWQVVIAVLIFLIIAPAFLGYLQTQIDDSQVEITQLFLDIKDEKINKITVEDNKLSIDYKDGVVKLSTKENSISFPELLETAGIEPSSVNYTVSDQTIIKAVTELVSILLPVLLIGGVFFFLIKSQTRGAQDIFSFGKSRAKLFSKGKQSVNFTDVAGVDDAKKELEEIVDFLKHPAKYTKMGARTPKGVLLVGPSGVGKTLLARAVAGQANVPFFSIAGSEFMEMLVGVGASRVRDLFSQAKAKSPSIIFIDEIDAIGRQRGRGMMGGHEEREQTLNQILVEMDGFTPNDRTILIAATNRGDLLDPALLRPGRFDRRVILDMPDKNGREKILKIHAKGKKIGKGIKWGSVADRTVGFSGADLENMLNEAAILAARNNKSEIDESDIEEAATKVKLGPAKKRLQSENDKKITAYHEAGHAIVTHALPNMDPVHRISIVARGMSLGHTLIPPAADRTHETKSRMLKQIASMLGGRAAEEVVFNEMTSGASNDIQVATRLARAMVIEFGMSNLGPVNLGPQSEFGELGRLTMYDQGSISPAMQERVDNEVKRILDTAYKTAVSIIKKERKILDNVSSELLKKETLDKDAFEKITGPKPASSRQ